MRLGRAAEARGRAGLEEAGPLREGARPVRSKFVSICGKPTILTIDRWSRPGGKDGCQWERLRALGSGGRGSHRAPGGGERDYRRRRGRSSRRSDPGAVGEAQAAHGAGRRGYSRPGGEDVGRSEPQAAAITAKVDETRPVNPTVNRPKHDQSLGRKRGIQRPISGAFVNRKEYR